MCSPFLNGTQIGSLNVPRGGYDTGTGQGEEGSNFYQLHWFQFPLLSWVTEGLTTSLCLKASSFDVGYLTEVDPLWDDDELTNILNPESALFANLPAIASCAADSVKATATGFGMDEMFWCSGSQGHVYPLNGNVRYSEGGIDGSLNMTHRLAFKLARQGVVQDTSSDHAMCANQPMPLLRKTQFKTQMIYPVPQTTKAYGFGASSSLWSAGHEFPFKGEDFVYLLWRKNKCCAL